MVPALFYSSNELRCKSPRQVPGTVVLEVTMNGVDFSVSGKVFSFAADASVMEVFPTSGPPVGGTFVTITGSYFVQGMELYCRFGDIIVPFARYVSSNEIICISPPSSMHRAEAVFVEVTNNNHTFSNNMVPFFYHPTVDVLVVNPTRGPSTLEETPVVVKGTNFRDEASLSCRIDDLVVAAQYLSPTELVCFVPAHFPGTFALEVSLNGADFTTSAVEFTYDPSVLVTQIWPVLGPAAMGGSILTIRGDGFYQNTDLACRLGQAVVPAHFINNQTILCKTPPSRPGLVSVEVTNNMIHFSASGLQFLYVPDASVYAVTPSKGPATGQYPVFFTGSNFLNTTALGCKFDSLEVRGHFLSPRVVMCVAPQRFAGSIDYAKIVTVEVRYLEAPHASHASYSRRNRRDHFPLFQISFSKYELFVPLQVTNNGLDYTDSGVKFQFYDRCQQGTSFAPLIRKLAINT